MFVPIQVGRSIYSILAYQNITQNHTILGPGNSEESLASEFDHHVS